MIPALPWQWKAAATLIALAVIGVAVFAFVRYEQHQGALACTNDVNTQALKAVELARTKDQQIAQLTQEKVNANQQVQALTASLAAADAASASSSAIRLFRHITAIDSAAPGDSAVARKCAADRDTLGQVLRSCVDEYRQMGSDADGDINKLRGQLGECNARYEALRSQ